MTRPADTQPEPRESWREFIERRFGGEGLKAHPIETHEAYILRVMGAVDDYMNNQFGHCEPGADAVTPAPGEVTRYTELIARLKAAEGPDLALAHAACLLFIDDPDYPSISTLLVRAIVDGSIDAALALVEKLLPWAGYSIIRFDNGNGYQVELADELVSHTCGPIALLIALLVALQEMEPRP